MKRGIKHNTFSLIYDFKQEVGESVKNAARRMKRYVKRCPREELPTEERHVSRFIEGLRSEMLKKDLYMRGCRTLEDVTKIAIDLVDNCKIYEEDSSDAYSDKKSTKSTEVPSVKPTPRPGAVDYQQLTEELFKKVAQVQKPLRRCYTCGGDHLNKDCPVLPQPPKLKWCAIEQKYTNHTTEECYYNKGYVRERPAVGCSACSTSTT